MRYRADIDGLRAIAVLAVIVYHAGLGLSGGYVGVDVFFVISGFLITTLIGRDLDRGTFSMRDFWRRRIVRIWPASMVMMLAVLVASLVVMAPGDLITTSKDAISQLFLAANIHYWRTTDYFGPLAEFRPLLHCWSLAVEEQFYLLLPPLLVGMWAFGRRPVVITLLLGSLLSLGLSVATLDRHPWAAFYLLPTRAWEMGLGSLLALRGVEIRKGGIGRELLAIAGLAAMLLPAFVYDAGTPFPGLSALPVCLGTAILIATPGSRTSRVLAAAPLRAIGLVSYSLYLWHWPILALLRYVEGPVLSVEQTIWALVGTVVLGTLSWRFVEQPFRRSASRIRIGAAFGAAAAATACGVLVAGGIVAMRGLPGRFSPEESLYVRRTSYDRTWIGDRPGEIGESGPTNSRSAYLLIGDSHAAAIGPAFDDVSRRRGIRGHATFKMGNLPLPSDRLANRPEWSTRMIAWAIEERIPRVVLCARWSRYLEIEIEEECTSNGPSACRDRVVAEFVHEIDALARRLEEHGIELWMLLEVPQAPHPVFAGVRSRLLDEPLPMRGPTLEEHLANQGLVRSMVSDLEPGSVRLFDLADFCFVDGEGAARYRDDAGVFYKDDNHLSIHGARMLMSDAVDRLLELMPSTSPGEHASSRSESPTG